MKINYSTAVREKLGRNSDWGTDTWGNKKLFTILSCFMLNGYGRLMHQTLTWSRWAGIGEDPLTQQVLEFPSEWRYLLEYQVFQTVETDAGLYLQCAPMILWENIREKVKIYGWSYKLRWNNDLLKVLRRRRRALGEIFLPRSYYYDFIFGLWIRAATTVELKPYVHKVCYLVTYFCFFREFSFQFRFARYTSNLKKKYWRKMHEWQSG